MKEVVQRHEIGGWSFCDQLPVYWPVLRHSSPAWELRREWAKGIMQTASLTERSNHRHRHLLGGLIRVGGQSPDRASGMLTAVQSVSKMGLPFLLLLFWSGLGDRVLLIYKSNCMLICETYLGEFHPFSILQRSLDIQDLERSYTLF